MAERFSRAELSVLEANDCILVHSLFAVRSLCPRGSLSSAVVVNVAQVAVLVPSHRTASSGSSEGQLLTSLSTLFLRAGLSPMLATLICGLLDHTHGIDRRPSLHQGSLAC